MAAEQLVVELVLDATNVDTVLDQLTKSGAIDSKLAAGFKATTAEMNKQAVAAKATAAAVLPIGKNLDSVNKSVKNLSKEFSAGFADGLRETLDEAGVSLEEFKTALEDSGSSLDEVQAAAAKLAETSEGSLRKQLREVTLELGRMKLAGEDNTEAYRMLTERAGELKDTMADVNAEVSNAGSDTRNIDNLLGSVTAIAGGFAAVQGTIALFGDENEELQEVLLRVNAAMAVLQGLQAVSNALQKEGAISLTIANAQRKIQNAQLIVENGLQSKNVVVKGAATVAQYALNAAMAANPIGLVVVAIAGIIAALAAYTRIAGTAAERTGALNAALKASGDGFDASADAIRKQSETLFSELEQRGVRQSEILRAQAEQDKAIAEDRIRALETARNALRAFDEAGGDYDAEERIAILEVIAKREKEIDADRVDAFKNNQALIKQLRQEDLENALAVAEARALVSAEGSPEQLRAQKAAIDRRVELELNADGLLEGERTKIIEQGRKDREQLDVDYQRRRLENTAKGIENELITVREGTEEEYALRRRLIAVQTNAELANTKLSEAEKLKIRERGLQEQALLDRNYSEAQRRRAIESEIARNEAELSLINIASEDKLSLQINNIELASQLEIDAALGNAAEIKRITAARDAAILATKKQFLDEALQYELDLQSANDGPLRRSLERTKANDRATFESRRASIEQLAEMDTEAVDARINTLNQEYSERLISDKDYNLRWSQLQDEKAKITEDKEREITDSIRAETEIRTAIALEGANAALTVFSMLADNRAQIENDYIAGQRQRLEELKQAGAITERDAIARAKRIDAEERRIKTQQAQRDKALAIFNAVIATAQAVVNSLKVGLPYGAVLAAIAAGLGAAQVAIIASKPVPRFGTGKKNTYAGPAEVGETGGEMVVRDNGKMEYYKKSTIIELNAKDKVYNPAETRRMLTKGGQRVDNKIINYQAPTNQQIDYDKLGRAVARYMPEPTSVSIDKNGFNVSVRRGLEERHYFDQRYSNK